MIRTLLVACVMAGFASCRACASEIVVVDGTRISLPDGLEPVRGTLGEDAKANGLQRALNRAFVVVHGHAEGLALFSDPRHPGNSLVLGRAPIAPADWPAGSTEVITPVPGTPGTDHRIYLVMSRSHIVPVAAVECGYGAFKVDGGRSLPKGHARCMVTGRFTRSLGFELRDPDLVDDGDQKALGLAVRHAVETLFPES